MRLNGWARVGIVLSVLWLAYANTFGLQLYREKLEDKYASYASKCTRLAVTGDSLFGDMRAQRLCNDVSAELLQKEQDELTLHVNRMSVMTTIAAWVLGVAFFYVWRWVVQGFKEPAKPNTD